MATSSTTRPAGDQLLRVQREMHRSAVIVRVTGEIDLSSHLALRAELFDACDAAQPPARVVLDLTGVEFLASVGLTELLVCHELAKSRGTPLRVVASGHRVLRPIEVSGVGQLLDIYPDVDEALRAT